MHSGWRLQQRPSRKVHSLKVYSLTFPQDKTVVPVLDWDKTGTTENRDTSILRYANTGPIIAFSVLEIVRLQYRRGGKGGHSKNRGVLVLTHMSPRHEMRVGAIACTHVPTTYVPSFRATSPQIQSVACRGGAQESCSCRRPHCFPRPADRALFSLI